METKHQSRSQKEERRGAGGGVGRGVGVGAGGIYHRDESFLEVVFCSLCIMRTER